jgi:hypothetical protein
LWVVSERIYDQFVLRISAAHFEFAIDHWRLRGDDLVRKICQPIVLGLIISLLTLVTCNDTFAQYPVSVRPVVSSVVSYVPMRRGLFGRRIVYRPVVTPVTTFVPVAAPTVVARPVSVPVVVARPVSDWSPVVVRYAPAPPIPRVSAYYTPMPPAPVAIPYLPPVTTYRIPITTYGTVIGY